MEIDVKALIEFLGKRTREAISARDSSLGSGGYHFGTGEIFAYESIRTAIEMGKFKCKTKHRKKSA